MAGNGCSVDVDKRGGGVGEEADVWLNSYYPEVRNSKKTVGIHAGVFYDLASSRTLPPFLPGNREANCGSENVDLSPIHLKSNQRACADCS